MKNIILCHALLIALLPFSLQAMDAPQRNIPKLSNIEKSLIIREIQQNGIQTILNQINDPNIQILTIRKKFERKSDDTLAQNIFLKVDEIEKKPRTNNVPRNYLGSETRYFFNPSNQQNKVQIIARLSNATEIHEICAHFDK